MIDKKEIRLEINTNFDEDDILHLYKLNKWSSANKAELLIKALKNSHNLVIAYYKNKPVGLGNALSDGYLAVYYSHLLVHPDFQGQGIGKMIMDKFQEIYSDFHQQVLIADGKAIEFFKKCGFERAGNCEPMWIFKGDEH